MRQTIHISMDDGAEYTVESDGRDIRAWESEYERSWFGPISFTKVAQVAYLAGKRTGVLNGTWPDYETFDAHCVDADGRPGSPVSANPTQRVHTDDSSALLPSDSTVSPRRSRTRARKS